MSDTNAGRPESAFPSTFKSLSPEEGQVHRWGMTLRDYFAAKAMQSMYISESFPTGLMKDTAKEAYEMADEMLRAREVT